MVLFMRIFLTGATGYVGTAVLDAIVRAGHEPLALVRTPETAERVATRGVRPVVGELAAPESWVEVAATCEAIIHTAFEGTRQGVSLDRLTIDGLLDAARRRTEAGAATTLVYTSGIWVLGDTLELADETAPVNPPDLVAWRPSHEQLVLDAASSAVRAAVIRPGIVYGGARGIVADLLKEGGNGLIRIIGTGTNHWPCVYDRDLADLYARVVANPEAQGIYHATDEADERVEDIVEAIAEHSKTRADVRRVPIAEARTKLGPIADALVLDQRVRSPRARTLGWEPTLHSIAGNVARLLEEFRDARAAA